MPFASLLWRQGTGLGRVRAKPGRWEGSSVGPPVASEAATANLGNITDNNPSRGMLSVSINEGTEAMGAGVHGLLGWWCLPPVLLVRERGSTGVTSVVRGTSCSVPKPRGESSPFSSLWSDGGIHLLQPLLQSLVSLRHKHFQRPVPLRRAGENTLKGAAAMKRGAGSPMAVQAASLPASLICFQARKQS